MTPFHIFLALFVMVLWGFNFVMIHVGLEDFPPLFLCFLRFFFTSMPLVFFIKRPAISWNMILLYGLLTFGLQYVLLFLGMQMGMPAGLAALLYQTHVFFTIIFASFFFKEWPRFSQILGILIAFSGIAFIAFHLDGEVTLAGFLLTIGGAIVWAMGNILSKKAGNVNMVALVVWGNFVSWPPVLLLSFFMEYSALSSLQGLNITWDGIGAALYIAYASTLFCFSIWSYLLHIYPVATVIPFTLSVPVFSMIFSYLITHEPIYSWKIISAGFILTGLIINIFGEKWHKKTN